LQVNHIKLVARGGTDSKRNLQTECEKCHSKNPYHGKLRKELKKRKARERAKRSALTRP
jgi:5-methylcytosine-specific restriction endonuclease McrA